MIKHIILWTLKDEFSDAEKAKIKASIKTGLEGHKDKIPEIAEIKVYTERRASSTADLMLDSTFASEDDLKAYAKHPDHQEVANTRVRPFVANRSCLDFEI